MLSATHVDQLCDLLRRVGDEELLPRFRAQVPNPVHEKTSSFDVFSEADEAAEDRISEAIAVMFPDALIIGEERTGNAPGTIEKLADAPIAFLIDPIDGTKNFTSGLPLFGAMIAAVSKGEIVFAAIHDPITVGTATALRGAGAWLRRAEGDDQRLRVALPCEPSQMNIVAGTNFLPPELRPVVQKNLSKFAMNFWLRCAAHEYRLAASGNCELLVYNKLKPWDHAAGWLLHQEAGGFSAHFDGSHYKPFHTTGGLICATDQDSWHAARDCLFGSL
ncbi:inositol monophosphatase family protein [Paracoccus isoporae]|nr:inositol monophosphatase [Paracoccus isoporae]